MKKLLLLLLIICVLLSCSGKQDKTNNEATYIAEQQLSIDTLLDNIYYRDFIDNYDTNLLVKIFEIEGNFTNSGNKELLVFYQSKRKGYNFIDRAICFVLDSVNEKVQNVYEIPDYWSLQFTPGALLPMENLGRNIIWLDAIIGYIGDFNENGKEELYLYRRSGMGDDLYIFEFDGREFVNITDREYELTYYIVEAYEENKIIKLLNIYGRNEHFIKWNDITQRYEEM